MMRSQVLKIRISFFSDEVTELKTWNLNPLITSNGSKYWNIKKKSLMMTRTFFLIMLNNLKLRIFNDVTGSENWKNQDFFSSLLMMSRNLEFKIFQILWWRSNFLTLILFCLLMTPYNLKFKFFNNNKKLKFQNFKNILIYDHFFKVLYWFLIFLFPYCCELGFYINKFLY